MATLKRRYVLCDVTRVCVVGKAQSFEDGIKPHRIGESESDILCAAYT